MNIVLITTGGTIDGADADLGRSQPTSALLSFLQQDPTICVGAHVLCNKDSREITDLDRSRLLDLVKSSPSDRILIGHGTFTICETGRYLKSGLSQPPIAKSVILVGSWIPFNEPSSDAAVQVLDALKFLSDGDPGVFIAMDGRLWNPTTTEKRKSADGEWRLVDKEEQ